MPHNQHTTSTVNQDLLNATREQYLEKTKHWVDPLGEPIITEHDGIKVVRDDYIVGSKARFADLLLSRIESDTIVYVQPRFGLAGVSILDAAKRYNKRVVLFMPSSKRISHHQACCIERGAEPHFYRIAAMPNLNRIAKEWADSNDAVFIPLGLKHPMVTACIVRVCETIREKHGDPDHLWYAVSTGVLSRGLQIGFPNTQHHGVAVSRNLHDGERGIMTLDSHPLAFTQGVKPHELPPFPTVNNYDAKVWGFIDKTKANTWMWNVGKEPELNDSTIFDRIDSYRDWAK